MIVREANVDDADGVSGVLTELLAAGKRSKASDPGFALNHYIADPDRILCSVAVDDDGTILGFQSLKHAREGNPYGTPVGWGIIGTHVRPTAARRGVGRALFAVSEAAARGAGIEKLHCYGRTERDTGAAHSRVGLSGIVGALVSGYAGVNFYLRCFTISNAMTANG